MTTQRVLTVERSLEKVREYLEMVGWCGSPPGMDEDGKVCLSLALDTVVKDYSEGVTYWGPVIDEMNRRARELGYVDEDWHEPGDAVETVMFNDAPGRTFEEIKTFLGPDWKTLK